VVSMHQHADVIVVGAGPGGSVTAARLARRGWNVLLLDRTEFPREKVCGDGLTPRAVNTLRFLGLESLVTEHAYPIHQARLYASPAADFTLPFDPHVAPLPPRGYVLPRYHLDDLLRKEAIRQGATFLPHVRVNGFLREGGRIVGIQGAQGGRARAWRSSLVVLATGASIALLKALGIVRVPPHDVLAVRGYWRGVKGLEPRFEFFFTPEVEPGYAWLFPVAEDTANIGVGLFVPASGTHRRPAQMFREFLRQNEELQQRLSHAERLGEFKGYPIRTDFPSHRVHGPGYLIVGEAAGLVNPITGEGIDLAMESGILAADVADVALRQGNVSAAMLRRYERTLRRRFGRMFRGLRFLRGRVMRSHTLDMLIRRARRHPGLARRIMAITLGTTSPYTAFLPSSWWWIMRG